MKMLKVHKIQFSDIRRIILFVSILLLSFYLPIYHSCNDTGGCMPVCHYYDIYDIFFFHIGKSFFEQNNLIIAIKLSVVLFIRISLSYFISGIFASLIKKY